MLNDIGSDLDQFLPERRERPVAHFTGQGWCPHEVGKIVGEGKELKAHRVTPEPVPGELRPLDRVLPLFVPLLGSASLVVEVNHGARMPPEISHDEPYAGEEASAMPFHLDNDAAGLRPALRPVAETRYQSRTNGLCSHLAV